MNDLGQAEPWLAQYDKFGRLIGRTDITLGNAPEGIDPIHYHMYAYDGANGDILPSYTGGWPQIQGVQSLDHIPGVYDPYDDPGACL